MDAKDPKPELSKAALESNMAYWQAKADEAIKQAQYSLDKQRQAYLSLAKIASVSVR